MNRRALLKAAIAAPVARLAPLIRTGPYWIGNTLYIPAGTVFRGVVRLPINVHVIGGV